MTGPAPERDGFFGEPSLLIMLGKELGLGIYQFGRISFERCGDLRVQLLASTTQKAAVCRVLHQRVLEAVDRFGRRASLEHQLGTNEATESGFQLVVGKTRDG